MALPWLAAKRGLHDLADQPRTCRGPCSASSSWSRCSASSGLGVGALLRNQIVAVSVGVIFLLVLNNVWLPSPAVKYVYPYTPGGAVNSIFTITGGRVVNHVTLLSAAGRGRRAARLGVRPGHRGGRPDDESRHHLTGPGPIADSPPAGVCCPTFPGAPSMTSAVGGRVAWTVGARRDNDSRNGLSQWRRLTSRLNPDSIPAATSGPTSGSSRTCTSATWPIRPASTRPGTTSSPTTGPAHRPRRRADPRPRRLTAPTSPPVEQRPQPAPPATIRRPRRLPPPAARPARRRRPRPRRSRPSTPHRRPAGHAGGRTKPRQAGGRRRADADRDHRCAAPPPGSSRTWRPRSRCRPRPACGPSRPSCIADNRVVINNHLRRGPRRQGQLHPPHRLRGRPGRWPTTRR